MPPIAAAAVTEHLPGTDRWQRWVSGTVRERPLLAAHALHSAGTSAVAVAVIGGTLGAGPSTVADPAQLSRYVLLTLVPFALAAPLLAKVFGSGRWSSSMVIPLNFAVRVGLVGALAALLDTPARYALVFAFLTCQKAHGVAAYSRLAAVVPEPVERLAANARLNRAAIAAGGAGSVLAFGLLLVAPTRSALVVAGWLFAWGALRTRHGLGPGALGTPDVTDDGAPIGDLARRACGSAAVAFRGATGMFLGLIAAGTQADGGGLGALVIAGAGLGVGGGLGTVLGPRLLDRLGVGRGSSTLVLGASGAACLAAAASPSAVSFGIAAAVVGLGGNLCKQQRDAAVQAMPDERDQQLSLLAYDAAGQIAWAAAAGTIAVLAPAPGLGLAAVALLLSGSAGALALLGTGHPVAAGRQLVVRLR